MKPESRNISILSYISPIGWLIALASRELTQDHSQFSAFHLRQGMALAVLEAVFYIIFHLWLDIIVLKHFCILVFIVLSYRGISAVTQGLMRHLPLFGELADRLFEQFIPSDGEE